MTTADVVAVVAIIVQTLILGGGMAYWGGEIRQTLRDLVRRVTVLEDLHPRSSEMRTRRGDA